MVKLTAALTGMVSHSDQPSLSAAQLLSPHTTSPPRNSPSVGFASVGTGSPGSGSPVVGTVAATAALFMSTSVGRSEQRHHVGDPEIHPGVFVVSSKADGAGISVCRGA